MASDRMYRERTRPSAVSPAMATPMWSSTLKIFFWWEESSELALLTQAKTTWVFDRSPIAAEPCFTASIEYSTWNSLPVGLHVVTSVSYWFLNIFFFLLFFLLLRRRFFAFSQRNLSLSLCVFIEVFLFLFFFFK